MTDGSHVLILSPPRGMRTHRTKVRICSPQDSRHVDPSNDARGRTSVELRADGSRAGTPLAAARDPLNPTQPRGAHHTAAADPVLETIVASGRPSRQGRQNPPPPPRVKAVIHSFTLLMK